jgi:hypothetical protein
VQVQVEPSGVAAPWRSAVAAADIAAAVALVFGSALGHPFLPSHDDGQYVLWNEVIRDGAEGTESKRFRSPKDASKGPPLLTWYVRP